MKARSSTFQRLLLPGFAFKAVVIGGGYATGRELAEFFLPSGPRGGLLGMLLAMLIWSAVAVATFLFAQATASRDYRGFFANLLGPFWPLFEIAYLLFVVLIVSVFCAAAGAIGTAVFSWPSLLGTLILMVGIAVFTAFGNEAVERLFKYVTFFLYAVYAVFVILTFSEFGARIVNAFVQPSSMRGWAAGGLTYAGYNIIGAIVILPVLRHLRSPKDAVIAGFLAGPLAMIPAVLFFLCMVAWYPEITGQTLPSDFLLERLNVPAFRLIFQAMIFCALLESGTGSVHAINERLLNALPPRAPRLPPVIARALITTVLLILSVVVAERYGLVTLIARGYRLLAWIFLSLYVLPLMTYGVWRLWRAPATSNLGSTCGGFE